jgi:4-amino-4-deoxy-L-arabinose transferase-like glycosyltransferase
LYRIVRRLAGALAGIVAAAVLVFSPATVALNRGNISDTLMVLLLVLAADATITAVISGRLRSLIFAGIFVGLAFQAKMVEAWLVLPALAVAYLLADGGGWGQRLKRLGGTALVVGAVSLSWMLVVSIWPAADRPYVDGSQGNSIFSQVFVYNGFGRLDQASPNQLLTKAIGLQLGSGPPGWSRLLTGSYGRDTAWLIPASLIALAVCLIISRRETDLLRAGSVLWGSWLVVLLAAFSASSTINAYYTAALSPAIAGLLGTGVALAWERRASPAARLAVATTVGVTCGYAVWLLPAKGVGLVAGLPEACAALGLAAVAKQVAALLAPLEQADHDQPDLMATQTSAVAAPFIYDSGQEVVPIGGYTGTTPEPSLAALKSMIARGDFHIVIQAPTVSDPRLVWIARNCLALKPGTGASSTTGGLRFAVYYCGRPQLS